jgi:hypothetical protein
MSNPDLTTIEPAELADVTGGRSPAADEAIKSFATQLTQTMTEIELGKSQQSSAVRDMVMQRLMAGGGLGGVGGIGR